MNQRLFVKQKATIACFMLTLKKRLVLFEKVIATLRIYAKTTLGDVKIRLAAG